MRATPPLIETAQCLCLASRRAARAITRAYDRELRAHGLRATQFSLLAVLSLKGPQAIGDLAETLGADRTTISRNLAPVEARGLITIGPHATDARARLARITPTGQALLEAAHASWRKVQTALTEDIGDDTADTLRRLAGSPARKGSPPRPAMEL